MGTMVGPSKTLGPYREALRACRLFADLDETSLDLCASALRPRRFRKGETIFHSGDPGDSLFLVGEGAVKITIPPDDGSEPAILTTIGQGGFFGELSLLDGAPRSATAVALEPTETYILRRDAFDSLMDEQPILRHTLLVTLVGEIRRLTAQIEDLHFLDLPGRLARHLLRTIALREGRDPATADDLTGEYRLPWPYTQSELAGMIGGSRQSVNRLLADLVDEGLVRFDGDDIVIPDASRLAAAAHR
jgi:CRP/FNR family transcriptional regulator, cyclic AMP receptor protein